jgi:rare lipoprotein A
MSPRTADRRTRTARRAVLLLALAGGWGAAPALAQAPADASPEADEAADAEGDNSAPERPEALTLRASDTRVPAGSEVTLAGDLAPRERGRVVELEYRPAGREYETIARARTARAGGFRLSVRPERTGTFRAVTADGGEHGDATVSETVEVAATSELYVHANRHQLREHGLRVAGRLDPHRPDRRIALQRLTGKGWLTVDAGRTGDDGRYAIRWRGADLGSYTVRTVFRGTDGLDGDQARLDHPIYMYRKDEASYYGPGFYGNTTACGQTLRPDTMGVAHKRLPCGTRVRFHYRDRTRKVPVIDRGPYIEGRRWDLTEATREALRFPKGVDQIWATK